MRIVFMGTPDFAVPVLRRLIADGHELVGVFSQPDKPKGRGYQLLPTPVKQAAQAGFLWQQEKNKNARNPGNRPKAPLGAVLGRCAKKKRAKAGGA